MGKLTYFLGLQIKKYKNGTFLNEAKYNIELLKRFDVLNSITLAKQNLLVSMLKNNLLLHEVCNVAFSAFVIG